MLGVPLLPLDVLIVAEMGKNYSGTGMDPNVVGTPAGTAAGPTCRGCRW